MAAFLPPPPAPGGRTLVLGAGKAGGAMAHALEDLWPAHAGESAPLSGLVVTRYGHTPPRQADRPPRIRVVEAAHPVPDLAGLNAAREILSLTQGLTERDLVICLISGGGSALLTLPFDGISLEQKQAVNRALLHSGANIVEMNCVRKHLSGIKGGRLAQACAPARVVTLAISDVPGDDLSVIASGPTVPDASTCADALGILHRYGIELPVSVRQLLEQGTTETPKPNSPLFGPARHQVQLIATPWQSLQAAAEVARSIGLNAYILALARAAAAGKGAFQSPCVILSGGETTVTVRASAPGAKKGRGGRAAEFCLGLAQALQGAPGVHAIAADTDGIDGTEDNAGAFVAPDTLHRAKAADLGVDDHLTRNDAYGFFSGLDDLVVSGPTYTNVNDFRALLIL
jgi:glycerate 2-kinase